MHLSHETAILAVKDGDGIELRYLNVPALLAAERERCVKVLEADFASVEEGPVKQGIFRAIVTLRTMPA